MLSALTRMLFTPRASPSSFAICAVLRWRLPAFTFTDSAFPHSSSTAGQACTVTLLTVPYFSTRERTLLAAIAGRKSCASTSISTIAPANHAAIRPALRTAQLRSLASLRVGRRPGGA